MADIKDILNVKVQKVEKFEGASDFFSKLQSSVGGKKGITDEAKNLGKGSDRSVGSDAWSGAKESFKSGVSTFANGGNVFEEIG